MIHDTNNKGGQIFIDGGHNDSAGQALAEQLQHWNQTQNLKTHLIVAMVDRKDPAVFLKPLVPYVESVTITTIPDVPDVYSIDSLEELIAPLGFKNVKTAPNPETALTNLDNIQNSYVLMTGSLYFVGHIMLNKKY